MARLPVRHFAALVVLLGVFWGVLIAFQFRNAAFEGGSATYGDEAPHFLNALLIRDYALDGIPGSPIRFAERYFMAYPKLAFLAWPPLFHGCLAGWLLVFPGSVASALLFVSLLTAGVALLIFEVARSSYGSAYAGVAAIAFCTLPITQHLDSVVMIEGLLALLSLGFAWQLAIYIDEPTRRNAIQLGLLGAACCLTKGNGVAALLSAPVAFLLAGRWRLAFRPFTLQAAALAAVLSAAPMIIAFRLLIQNQSLREGGLGWIAKSLPGYTAKLLTFCTLPLAAFIALGVVLCARPLVSRRPLPPIQAAMLAGILGVFGFHVIFPHPMDSRYMFAAVPLCLFFLPASAPSGKRWGGWGVAAWMVAVAALYLSFGFSFRRAVPAGFREALASIRQRPGGERIRAVIASDDTGESAFVVAAAESNARRNDVVVRSSKLLAESDWFRRRVRRLVESPGQFVNRSESLGLAYLIFDRTKLNTRWELELIDEAIREFPGRLERIAEFPAGTNRLRTIEVYRFTQAANPPRELLKYRMPYSLGREISEAPQPLSP